MSHAPVSPALTRSSDAAQAGVPRRRGSLDGPADGAIVAAQVDRPFPQRDQVLADGG